MTFVNSACLINPSELSSLELSPLEVQHATQYVLLAKQADVKARLGKGLYTIGLQSKR